MGGAVIAGITNSVNQFLIPCNIKRTIVSMKAQLVRSLRERREMTFALQIKLKTLNLVSSSKDLKILAKVTLDY